MNSVSIVGRLVYEPELKQTQNGTTYLSTRIAVSRNDAEKTSDFINVRAWKQTAEFIKKYFHKGEPIGILGRLRSENYEKQDGTKVSETYVLISEVSFVPGKPKNEQSTPTVPNEQSTPTAPIEPQTDDYVPGLPFEL